MLDVTVAEVPAVTYAVIRDRAPLERMSEVIPALIERTGAWVKDVGAAGPPVCISMIDADGMLDVKVGWPVETDRSPPEPIELVSYSTTRAVVHRHVGPYEELNATYRELSEAMDAAGLEKGDEPREIYESDPQEVTDPKDYVTQIVWPVK
jgi:effector-binding domain-containing protein